MGSMIGSGCRGLATLQYKSRESYVQVSWGLRVSLVRVTCKSHGVVLSADRDFQPVTNISRHIFIHLIHSFTASDCIFL